MEGDACNGVKMKLFGSGYDATEGLEVISWIAIWLYLNYKEPVLAAGFLEQRISSSSSA